MGDALFITLLNDLGDFIVNKGICCKVLNDKFVHAYLVLIYEASL